MRAAIPTCLLALLACKQNPGFDGPAEASVGETTFEAPTTTTTTTTTPPGSATTSTGGSATDVAVTTGPSPDPTTTTGLDPVDPTTSTASSSSTSTTADDTTTSDDTTGTPDPPPDPVRLQRYDANHCQQPLWCYQTDQGPDAGLAARTESQECFDLPGPPPYDIVRLGYVIRGVLGPPDEAIIKVHAWSDAGPVEPPLATRMISGNDLTLGPHAIVLVPPIPIDVARFCIGLSGGNKNQGTGIGVAVDTAALMAMQSYGKVDGGGECKVPQWTDITSLNPTPKGAWCIDADVVPSP